MENIAEPKEPVVRAMTVIRIKISIRPTSGVWIEQEPNGLVPPKPNAKVNLQQLNLSDSTTARIGNPTEETMKEASADPGVQKPEIKDLKEEV